jgi:ribosomal protein S18 acetylase RimI-like enzyme
MAERTAVPVGCLHMQMPTDFFGRRHAHISVIATTEAAEGSGVGRALMAHAEAWTRRRKLPLLTLNVFDANARARRFYERAGFTPEVIKYVKAF